jgi:hypothetical protein
VEFIEMAKKTANKTAKKPEEIRTEDATNYQFILNNTTTYSASL